jgi:hypothetical protein
MEPESLRSITANAEREESISAYAARHGGTDDLDPDLEAASIEHLLEVK